MLLKYCFYVGIPSFLYIIRNIINDAYYIVLINILFTFLQKKIRKIKIIKINKIYWIILYGIARGFFDAYSRYTCSKRVVFIIIKIKMFSAACSFCFQTFRLVVIYLYSRYTWTISRIAQHYPLRRIMYL